MNTLITLFCHNRPQILGESIRTLLTNAEYPIDELHVIDDGSQPHVAKGLMDFVLSNKQNVTKFTLTSFSQNEGYGVVMEYALNYIKWRNPQYYVLAESDYIWRKNWLAESMEILKAYPNTLLLSATHHPDYVDQNKIQNTFPRIVTDDFGPDVKERDQFYKPWKLKLPDYDVELMAVSNTCGTVIGNWQNLKDLMAIYPEMEKTVIERSCNKQEGGNRRYFGDGIFSAGQLYYFYKYDYNGRKDDHAILSVSDVSLADHICGAGINGGIVPEGHTFVSSPSWKGENFVRPIKYHESKFPPLE